MRARPDGKHFLSMHPTPTLQAAPAAWSPCAQDTGRSLRSRLAAVRATLESLGRTLPREGSQNATVLATLRELEHLGHDLRAVLDWSMPAEPRPIDCTHEEIGLGAVQAFSAPLRQRVLVSYDQPARRVRIDGPMLSRCLAYLIEHELCAGGNVALHVRSAEERTVFAISAENTAGAATDAQRDGRPLLALGLAVAERDLTRLGASVRRESAALLTVLALHESPGSAA